MPSAKAQRVCSAMSPAVACPSTNPPQYIARSATIGALLVICVANTALCSSA
jgi:hypothetical protein